MATLGTFLLPAFVVAAYAATVAGARRRSPRLVESGVGAFYVTALLTLASAVLVHAFVVDDYSINYVQDTRTREPLLFKIALVLGRARRLDPVLGRAAGTLRRDRRARNREGYRELIPYVVAIISVVELFFLFLMVVHNNPFSTFLAQVPGEGPGLTPLLQISPW